ncbi:MAG: TetR/AcrR family transcriptional regulator [Ruminococcus sp.]|nr:TetR/AcrR family transcriptional regulator [Ruminococcus sp.]
MRLTEKQTETLKRNNEIARENTRQNIRDAFLLLYKQHGNNGFTITDIIQRSGVSRSAFYRNYGTKDEILMDLVQKSVDEISDNISPSLSQNWEIIFQQAKKNREEFDMLRESNLTGKILEKMNETTPPDCSLANSNILWNGLIYNAILFYAASGYPDPRKAADEILCSMQHMAETFNTLV